MKLDYYFSHDIKNILNNPSLDFSYSRKTDSKKGLELKK